MANRQKKCGYVAIIGRPNVGKSTLLNKMIARKISITADKPQTTRHKICGIKTMANAQIIFVDTPGIHRKSKHILNRHMNKVAQKTINTVDVILFMIEGTRWTDDDDLVLECLQKTKVPVILVINKVDQIMAKAKLLPYLDTLNQKKPFADLIPISAQQGNNLEVLEQAIIKLLPESPFLFEQKQFTDRDDRFLAAEIIREKLVRFLGQELPYVTAVVIDEMVQRTKLCITATIFVEKEGQKAIIIGKGGLVLKKLGTLARRDIEQLLHRKVFLTLWVKVKNSWSSDQASLEKMGYI